MSRAEFLALVKKSGVAQYGLAFTAWEGTLEKFAELVAQHEREACAAICDQRKITTPEWQLDQHYNQATSHCAQAIRLRSRK
jgi:hypothetical protein